MKVDATTPVDELVNACSVPSILTHVGRKNRDAALAELTRRSELAAKYERLTRALASLKRVTVSTYTDRSPCVLVANGLTITFYGPDMPVDMSGDGIADAIIRASEAER